MRHYYLNTEPVGSADADKLSTDEQTRYDKIYCKIQSIMAKADEEIESVLRENKFYGLQDTLFSVEAYWKHQTIYCEHCGFPYPSEELNFYSRMGSIWFDCTSDCCGLASKVPNPY